eukprot:3550050-Prymnesium_polylepis.2
MVLLLFFIAIVRLYYAGFVPKLFLTASAHSVPASHIVKKLLARRHCILNTTIVAGLVNSAPHSLFDAACSQVTIHQRPHGPRAWSRCRTPLATHSRRGPPVSDRKGESAA